ncbi:RsfA family transcriptional regulator [Bacillus sp. FJAT-42376]|uniref:RsfA family transcriptional regulator n=1 Tax=Bacillus sp. FJAT-42376 TaxID=2014076 RepID=UPI000F4FE7E1|nr:RsfA family transcriptional regulator [Bacillus sp. FJAT-42376]AZB44681.1 RsfA family transcriptional regulator [Bacillus sp. FJAT-42376]
MMKQRQDAWSEENDLLLAETVLRHVREGSTQLNAFEEVGDKLNRTSAACGFRWNAVVRHQYEKALQLAKKQRKQKMRALGKGQPAKKKLLYAPPETALAQPVYAEETAEEQAYEPAISAYVPPKQEDVLDDEELNGVSYTSLKQPAPVSAVSAGAITMDQVIAFLETYESRANHNTALKQENIRLKRELDELASRNEELEMKIAKMEEDSDTIQEDYETLMKIMNRARKLTLFEEEDRSAPKFKMDRNGNLEKVAE